jgi:tRNA (guanine6-N2)-methyltransferase
LDPAPTTEGSSERRGREEELRILLTTDPGLEATVEEEVKEYCSARGLSPPNVQRTPTGHGGTVSVHFPSDTEEVRELLFELRSIHHILKELDLFRLPDERKDQLAAIRERVRHLKVPEFDEAPEKSFRVSCDRLGHHDFSSMEVLKEAGSAIQESYGLPVDLERFRFHFRVDIYEKACRIGLQWTTDALSKRKRPFLPRIALKGNIAYSLLKSLGASGSDEGTLLDPFCGSGTILLEASQVYPGMRLLGSDNYPGNIPGSDKNLRAFGVREKVRLEEWDARDLSERHSPGSIRYIATNPPYGLRMGSGMNFYQLYSKFLGEAGTILEEKGRLAVLIMKKGLFEEVLEQNGGFRTLEKRELIMGRIHTWLFVLEKVEG